MKKRIIYIVLFLSTAFLLCSCGKEITSILLSTNSCSISQGETVALTYTLLPNEAKTEGITWGSADPNVATVDANGVVTGVSKGNTSVFVSASNGIVATCNITVTSSKVKNVLLSQTTYLQTTFDTVDIDYSLSPEDASYDSIEWTSSDEAIVSVSNGTCTCNAPGQATVSLKVDGVEMATCTFTVEQKNYTLEEECERVEALMNKGDYQSAYELCKNSLYVDDKSMKDLAEKIFFESKILTCFKELRNYLKNPGSLVIYDVYIYKKAQYTFKEYNKNTYLICLYSGGQNGLGGMSEGYSIFNEVKRGQYEFLGDYKSLKATTSLNYFELSNLETVKAAIEGSTYATMKINETIKLSHKGSTAINSFDINRIKELTGQNFDDNIITIISE